MSVKPLFIEWKPLSQVFGEHWTGEAFSEAHALGQQGFSHEAFYHRASDTYYCATMHTGWALRLERAVPALRLKMFKGYLLQILLTEAARDMKEYRAQLVTH